MSNRTNLVDNFLELDARPVAGFPGYYATRDGRVFSILEMKNFLHADGYLRVNTFSNAKRQRPGVHVMVLSAFVGPRPPEQVCRHLDGKRRNNRLENLAWGTVQENTADKVRHGSHRGERCPTARLTEAAVRKIRAAVARGVTYKRLATKYGVSSNTIGAVVTRRNWKHVP